MNSKRRQFLKLSGLAGLGFASNPLIPASAAETASLPFKEASPVFSADSNELSIIGKYGKWAADLQGSSLPSLSFRRKEFTSLAAWKKESKKQMAIDLASPELKGLPEVRIDKQYEYDGLHIEELSWQLPYGDRTKAILLKPLNTKGPLPGILGFHDHAGNKYLGYRKITRTSDDIPAFLQYHYDHYYQGSAWANELARKGYVVLVHDAFAFGSRRVLVSDVPERHRKGLSDFTEETKENIDAYNKWAIDHESVMAKSLFSAGTTWPGVFLAEDRKALDILAARKDVDAKNIGCAGLSGGGLRTVMGAGMDERIKCAICVGFMTTWDDFVLNKSFVHTWMTYVPGAPRKLEFPEILGLRVPLPTLVLNNNEDQLFTLSEMKKADDILKEVYNKAGASGNYKASFYSGPHKFDKEMQTEAFSWFDKWLKK